MRFEHTLVRIVTPLLGTWLAVCGCVTEDEVGVVAKRDSPGKTSADASRIADRLDARVCESLADAQPPGDAIIGWDAQNADGSTTKPTLAESVDASVTEETEPAESPGEPPVSTVDAAGAPNPIFVNCWRDAAGDEIDLEPWMPREIEVLLEGGVYSPVLDDNYVYVSEVPHDGHAIPEWAHVVRIDKDSLEQEIIVTHEDGVRDPLVLRQQDQHLYIGDWIDSSIYRVPKEGGAVDILASGGVRATDMVIAHDHLYAAGYASNRIYRVALDGSGATGLYDTPSPRSIEVHGTSLYWGTESWSAWETNELMAGDIDGAQPSRMLEAAGIVSELVVADDSLFWADYERPSRLARIDLGEEIIYEQAVGTYDRYTYCSQPLALEYSNGVLFLGTGDGMYAVSPDGTVLRLGDIVGVGVHYIAVDETFIYFANREGLYRVSRPARTEP